MNEVTPHLIARAIALWLCLCFASAGSAQQPQDPAVDDLQPRLEGTIKAFLSENPLPALAVGVIVDSAEFTVFHGTLDGQRPLHRGAAFHAASLSKLLTAQAVMQLIQDNRLALGDRLEKHLPRLAPSEIRIHHLLTHRSGLRDRIRPSGATTAEDVQRYLGRIARQVTRARPGQAWRYADTNFNLLGEVIHGVTGESFADSMRSQVLAPLGMVHSSFMLADISADARVQGWRDGWLGLKPVDHPWDLSFAPSSGLQASLPDLLRFARFCLDRGEIDGRRLTSPQLFETMWEPRTETSWGSIRMGLAWQVPPPGRLGRVLQHAGSDPGFQHLFTLYPDRASAIVVLGSLEEWPRFELRRQIEDVLTE